MDITEKWRRMVNPEKLSDYGISISLDELINEAPDIYEREVKPYLPDLDLDEE